MTDRTPEQHAETWLREYALSHRSIGADRVADRLEAAADALARLAADTERLRETLRRGAASGETDEIRAWCRLVLDASPPADTERVRLRVGRAPRGRGNHYVRDHEDLSLCGVEVLLGATDKTAWTLCEKCAALASPPADTEQP